MSAQKYVSVPAESVEWLRMNYPQLCVKAGLCEQIAGTAYIRTVLQSTQKAPTLPRYLLDLIGEYGVARTDKIGEVEVQYRWELLIGGIKRYATDYARSAQFAAPAQPSHGGRQPVVLTCHKTFGRLCTCTKEQALCDGQGTPMPDFT